jgi:hypothetical protein
VQLEIKGKEYTLIPLSSKEQGENSKAYRIDGGWQEKADQPAIVKMPKQLNAENFKLERKYLATVSISRQSGGLNLNFDAYN